LLDVTFEKSSSAVSTQQQLLPLVQLALRGLPAMLYTDRQLFCYRLQQTPEGRSPPAAGPRPGPQPGPETQQPPGAEEGAGPAKRGEGDVVDAEFEVVDEDKKK